MNANDHGRRSLRRGLILIMVAASCAARAQADAPAAVRLAVQGDTPVDAPSSLIAAPGWPDSDIVDELLRRETRAALAAQQQRRGPPRGARLSMESDASTAMLPDAQPDRVDLAAIYGIGKRLDVEVLVNGQRLRYRHGSKWPDDAPDGDGAYALLAIQGNCVTLDRVGANRRACLSRGD
jgi:hypothetical protein